MHRTKTDVSVYSRGAVFKTVFASSKKKKKEKEKSPTTRANDNVFYDEKKFKKIYIKSQGEWLTRWKGRDGSYSKILSASLSTMNGTAVLRNATAADVLSIASAADIDVGSFTINLTPFKYG